MNRKETSIKCNGKLGKYYTLELDLVPSKEESLYSIDPANKLTINCKLIRDSLDDETIIKLTKKEATFKILINEEMVSKQNIDIDFSNTHQIVINYDTLFYNKEPIFLNVEAILEINDKAEYLTNTNITNTIALTPIKLEKLFIDLTSITIGNTIMCNITTTVKPEYLEYKVNIASWVKLNENKFSVEKTGKNQYIQVRGKQNGNYTYSNVIKIYEDEKL